MKILQSLSRIIFGVSFLLNLIGATSVYRVAQQKVDYISVMRYMSEAQYLLLMAILSLLAMYIISKKDTFE